MMSVGTDSLVHATYSSIPTDRASLYSNCQSSNIKEKIRSTAYSELFQCSNPHLGAQGPRNFPFLFMFLAIYVLLLDPKDLGGWDYLCPFWGPEQAPGTRLYPAKSKASMARFAFPIKVGKTGL